MVMPWRNVGIGNCERVTENEGAVSVWTPDASTEAHNN